MSGVLLMLIATHANLLGVWTVGYHDAFLRASLMLDVMIAAILLPTLHLLLYAFCLFGAFGVLAYAVGTSPAQVPVLSEWAANPLATAISLGAFFFAEVALIGFLRNEVVRRLAAQQELIDTLEERVAKRTAELKEANENLRALSRVKDEFVSNVSHELRTPITSIKLYHSLSTQFPTRYGEYLPVLTRETERLESMIEDLLTLSRLDQKERELCRKELDLNLLAQEYVSDRASLAGTKGLTLELDAAPETPIVQGDPNLMGQVLSIFLTNALNYTPQGGRVVVRTQRRCLEGQPWVGFSVSDTGPGIPPEEQAQLFTRFFRGKAGRESEVPGTGLGLAIAKEIIERHHGQVAVDSAGVPGQGTTFSIYLPASTG